MDSLAPLVFVALAVAAGWIWDLVAHRESRRLDRELRHRLRQSLDTIHETTLR
jgi:hypothetical protein